MNGPEERLTDALRDVGETIRPEDVPPPRFADRGTGVLSRPLTVSLAAAATVVVATAGVTAGVLASGDDGSRATSPPLPSQSASPSASAGSGADVSVFFCIETSSNPSCQGKDATTAQRRALRARVEKLPAVSRVMYESKEEAFERFKNRFSKGPDWDVRAGAIPDSLRIWLTDGANARDVQSAVLGEPGVDQVIVQ